VTISTEVIQSIEAALATWNREDVRQLVEEADQLRTAFVERFPLSAWPTLPVEHYALGCKVEGGTVCWWLEFHTKPVESISGGSAAKHIIWRRPDGTWRYPKAYASIDEAWAAVRAGFVEMLRLAEQGNLTEAFDVPALSGAVALRSKILFMYFPDQLLPVASKAHVNHFLRTLGEGAGGGSPLEANHLLLELLRSVPPLESLTTQELMFFLYHWADPRTAARVVKIAPGEQGRLFDDCLKGGFICIGWDEVGDLTEFASKEEFRQAFREAFPYNGNEAQVTRKSNELWTLMELEPGDKVIANRGTSEILGIGTVGDGGYQWRPERREYRHTLAVDWDTSTARKIEPVKAWATTTVKKVPASLYRTITNDTSIPHGIAEDSLYPEIEQALDRRGQVILYGPPGTGKTYAARRAAVWLLEGGTGNPAASRVLTDPVSFTSAETQLTSSRGANHQVWFMVANPSHWAWDQLFKDNTVDYSLGRLKRNYPRVRAGDLVVGYESMPTGRVVALARVTGEFDPEGSPDAALALEPLMKVSDGVTYAELRDDAVLAESEPVRFRCQGTLFELGAVEADRLLAMLAERDPTIGGLAAPTVQQLTRITFHPSYTCEDFVEGYRPQPGASGGFELVLTDGVFKQVCLSATADPGRRYVVLIDEINRGNIPKILGELILLIEKDKRGLTVRLPQSGAEFQVPPNVAIIATMNTADRSIHLLDTALRRRFAFVELMPDTEPLTGATAGALALDVFLENLNERIRSRVGREKQIGHAIFFSDGALTDDPESFAAVFRHELLPLLQEYLFEDYRELADLLGADVIDAGTERPTALIGDPEGLCASLAAQFGANAST